MYRFGDPDTGKGSSIVLWNYITLAQVASLVFMIVAFILMQDLKRRAQLAKMLAAGTEDEVPAAAVAVEEEIDDEEDEEEYIEDDEDEEETSYGEDTGDEESNTP